jgi:Rps23 Pro-64 3,4-dihydroxylase Tpa1-like proline 4-hydroxylase
MKGEYLNENSNVEKINDPYPIWILDNFIKQEIVETIVADWPEADNDEIWNSGYTTIKGQKNILEQGVRTLNNVEHYPLSVKSVMEYFHSKQFTNKLESITEIKGLIPDTTGRWTNMRVMLANSYQMIHSDARRHPQTGLCKELTCLLYLNKDYDRERDGGCLEVWDDEMTMCKHMIDPIFNRFVIFLNTDTSYHGVTQVKSDRKCLTFSVLADKPTISRTKALFVGRPEDDELITELGKKRAKVKDNEGTKIWKAKQFEKYQK